MGAFAYIREALVCMLPITQSPSIRSMTFYEGKTALVTGSASGIGKVLVQHLVDHGARVFCCDIDAKVGQAIVDNLNASQGTETSPVAWFKKLDVSSWEDTVDGFEHVDKALHSKLDFVFANAGMNSGSKPFTRETGKPNTRSVDVNFIGVMYTIQAAINHFRRHGGGGRIVVTASAASLYPHRMDPLYSATKHAVVGLVRSASLRTEKEGIYLNAVAPAFTESPLVPEVVMKKLTKLGITVTKEKIMKAFDIFLAPDCKLNGFVALPVMDKIHMFDAPTPPGFKDKVKL
ncbi:NAD(P)-binding protein [Cristinia sonorae]|uniref:NAD(P)-binding protein n=1 Tax=Cristinia sonorae TaxID=1940300 RepID=A0A8K0XSZ3_9AGAR|nr:NAD(P)-binding protein [Cristinia sonorae]